MKKTSLLIIIFVSLLFHLQVFGQSENIESIKINSSWSGLAPTSRSTLVIKNIKGKFYANDKQIEARLIEELLTQIKSEEARSLASLGITSDWLNRNAESAIPEILKKSLPNEKEFFINSFQNISLVEKILPRIFGKWTDEKGTTTYKYSTDDYPEFDMTIANKDGTTVTVASRRQTLFMFDNPNLGRAIAALLPRKFTNRSRLNGDYLAREIAEEIYDEIKEDLNKLETENRIGKELAQLRDRYKVRKTVINYLSSIDVGTPTKAYQTKEYKKLNFPSWNAKLERSDLPHNVIIGVSLPYKENKLIGFTIFTEKIDEIIRQTLSINWLSKYITEHPETEFEIRFVEDKSFSTKAKESFLKDLEKFGANGLSAEILSNIEKSVFLEVSENPNSNWSRWLILPDGRMILWQTKGSTTLKWKPNDFETLNLYDTNDWFQAKAVISTDGEILSR